ncbi:hypothetical protein F4859DRAFT_518450 [Xylaria cf. heliscus]|nr:hypothetical protein F4859DRAFT_518450 [Xylaria cf. heliscus]
MRIIGTDITTVYSRIKWFRDRVMIGFADNNLYTRSSVDALVLTELLTMIDESMRCNHTASRGRNRQGLSSTNTSMRINEVMAEVTAAVMSDIMCLIDTAMMYEASGNSISVINIACFKVTSGRHMGTIKMIFEIFQAMIFIDSNVTLHIVTTTDLDLIMKNVLSPKTSIKTYTNVDWSVVLNGDSIIETIGILTTKSTLVSMLVRINNPTVAHMMTMMVKELSMVMEMSLVSDPNLSMVRLRNSIWNPNSRIYRTILMHTAENLVPMISSITHSIRPIDLGRMCYNCRMIWTLATFVMMTIEGGLADIGTEMDTTWSESFATEITTNLDEFGAPI